MVSHLPGRHLRSSFGLLALITLGLVAPRPTLAQTPSQPQPEAITPATLANPPCPRIVPPHQWALQPLRIQPSQVPMKNRMGCLSAADAVYGPDGCPVKMCGAAAGARIPLR